jgi:hypothetical protein
VKAIWPFFPGGVVGAAAARDAIAAASSAVAEMVRNINFSFLRLHAKPEE